MFFIEFPPNQTIIIIIIIMIVIIIIIIMVELVKVEILTSE